MGIVTLLLYYPMWINNPHVASALAFIVIAFSILAYAFSFFVTVVIFTVSSACGALCIFYFPDIILVKNVGYIALLGAVVGSIIAIFALLVKEEDFIVFIIMLVSVIAFYYVSISVIPLTDLVGIN